MDLELTDIISRFDCGGEALSAEPYGSGHINRTYLVVVKATTGEITRYILQRINTAIFKDPAKLMANIAGVTDYLREAIRKTGGDPLRETLQVLRTREGALFYTDKQGGAWRMFYFVEGTVCLQSITSPDAFYKAAKAFGRFQKQLADYPAHTLYETIEAFHDTRDRLKKFEEALKQDAMGRAKDVPLEIAFVLERKADCETLMSLLEKGQLPLRVTHNDTKLNNILFDAKTGEGLCVVDLDTVMPGLAVNDFGDAIRFGANHSSEDEKDLSKVQFDLALFDIYTKGFLEAAGDGLTALEKQCLPWGAKLMTLECGMRFLTDYLQGDTYFHTHYKEQNLDRCRTQFKLVSDMEHAWQDMERTVLKYS